jgi:hypothetical protein
LVIAQGLVKLLFAAAVEELLNQVKVGLLFFHLDI